MFWVMKYNNTLFGSHNFLGKSVDEQVAQFFTDLDDLVGTLIKLCHVNVPAKKNSRQINQIRVLDRMYIISVVIKYSMNTETQTI